MKRRLNALHLRDRSRAGAPGATELVVEVGDAGPRNTPAIARCDKIRPMRALVVEDEEKVASFIAKGFEQEGYAVDVVYDGEAAIYQA